MKICTLCDKNYMKQARLMIESSGHKGIYILCLDDESYEYFYNRNYKLTLNVYSRHDIESPRLKRYRESHNHEHFCWALASYFLNYLREREDEDDLMYVDADIYFYRPVSEIKISKAIGIIEHRFKRYDPKRKVGHYNVGIIYFANTEWGNNALSWWSEVVLDDNNPYYLEYGTCGDQKYLELFQVLWPDEVEVIDVGHGAPWNTGTQQFDGDIITFQGTAQPLAFFHFSHFSIHGEGYATNRNGEWFPERTWAKPLYDEYYEKIKALWI